MKFNSIAVAALFGTLAFSSCKRNDDPAPSPTPGKTYMEFANVVGGSALELNNQWYKNANNDSFKVSKFNYYISNIKLNGTSGTVDFAEPESYHLIEQGNASQMAFNMSNVPGGKYKSVTLTIGVDSLRNVSGAQTGALDPSLGNFWSWNTGYIMLKFEGTSPSAVATSGQLVYHAGGFSGANNVLKTVTLEFPNVIEVSSTSNPHVHVQADLLKMFDSPNKIDFSQVTTIHMPGANAKKLADNYERMFSVTHAGL